MAAHVNSLMLTGLGVCAKCSEPAIGILFKSDGDLHYCAEHNPVQFRPRSDDEALAWVRRWSTYKQLAFLKELHDIWIRRRTAAGARGPMDLWHQSGDYVAAYLEMK